MTVMFSRFTAFMRFLVAPWAGAAASVTLCKGDVYSRSEIRALIEAINAQDQQ